MQTRETRIFVCFKGKRIPQMCCRNKQFDNHLIPAGTSVKCGWVLSLSRHAQVICVGPMIDLRWGLLGFTQSPPFTSAGNSQSRGAVEPVFLYYIFLAFKAAGLRVGTNVGHSIASSLHHRLDLHHFHGFSAQILRRVERKACSVSNTAVGNIPHQNLPAWQKF